MTLPAERAGHKAPDDLVERREGLAAAVATGVWRTDPSPEEVMLGGVRCLRFASPVPSRGTVMHMHGGAFRIGCPEQIAPFGAALAAAGAVDVICPGYRLAPEHPFPAALNDGWATLTALSASASSPLIVSGDSAGGALAAGLTSLSHKGGVSLACLALLSPWLDLTVSSASYAANAAHDPLFSAAAASEAAARYLQGTSPNDPLASPLFGSVAHFPPTLINVGTREVLVEDARAFHVKLRVAGIPAQLDLIKDMEHVAATRDLTLTGARLAFDGLVAFIDKHLPSD